MSEEQIKAGFSKGQAAKISISEPHDGTATVTVKPPRKPPETPTRKPIDTRAIELTDKPKETRVKNPERQAYEVKTPPREPIKVQKPIELSKQVDPIVKQLNLNPKKVADAIKLSEPPPAPTLTLNVLGNVDKKKAAELNTLINNRVPEHIKAKMNQYGTKITYAEKLGDVLGPVDVKKRPRGWPARSTWENVEGVYRIDSKEAVVADTFIPRGLKTVVESIRRDGVLFHEIGHAIDHSHDHVSAKAEFVKAHTDDKKSIPREDRKALGYFLQKGAGGPSETFAELAAQIMGEGSIRRNIITHFPSAFNFSRDCSTYEHDNRDMAIDP